MVAPSGQGSLHMTIEDEHICQIDMNIKLAEDQEGQTSPKSWM